MSTDFQVIFWGVRGSLPVPGADTIIFGGNTPCVQIQFNNRMIIMDAGTGIYKLGQQLLKKPGLICGDIFITHTHWDHIQGFPFFGPAFKAGNRFTLYGPKKTDLTFTDLMKGQMMYEHFPVRLDEMGANISFIELDENEHIDLGDGICLNTLALNHPGGALGYRIDYQGHSCCYLTDTEHNSLTDDKLKPFVQDCDIIIYDANFSNEEYNGYDAYPAKVGWGHSTWQEGIKLAQAANAKKLVLFHHANFHTDSDLMQIEEEARKHYPDSIVAREGLVITP